MGKKNILIPSAFFLVNVFVQLFNIHNKIIYFTDEGVYLYAAKLITQGHVLYKDFFLGQPPFLVYLNVVPLVLTHFDLKLYHVITVLWSLSIIFPLYWAIRYITKNTFATLTSLLVFLTYSEYQIVDVYSFAVRQTSLPFLAWAMYFNLARRRLSLAAFFLGLFSVCIVTNFALSILFITLLMLSERTFKNIPVSKILKKYSLFLLIFFAINIVGHGIIFFIPHGVENVFIYQMTRPTVSVLDKINILNHAILFDPAIFILGILSSFFMPKKFRFLGIFNVLGIFFLTFFTKSSAIHYLVILLVGLCITAGIFITKFGETIERKIIIMSFIITCLFFSSHRLFYYLFLYKTPDVYSVAHKLATLAEPLFTFQPIMGIASSKNLTFHYHVVDARYFTIMKIKKSLDYTYSVTILKNSSTIFLDEYARDILSPKALQYIDKNFHPVYKSPIGNVYVKNVL